MSHWHVENLCVWDKSTNRICYVLTPEEGEVIVKAHNEVLDVEKALLDFPEQKYIRIEHHFNSHHHLNPKYDWWQINCGNEIGKVRIYTGSTLRDALIAAVQGEESE